MKEHLRKKGIDLISNFSSLKAVLQPLYTNKKAVTAAKFLVVTTLLLSILLFSQTIIAQDRFSAGQAPSGNGGEFGAMVEISGCTNITEPGIYNLNATTFGISLKHCIRINTSDVFLNGQGFTLGTSVASGNIGIYIENSSASFTNITIYNISLFRWGLGIVMNNTIGGAIINNTLTQNIQGISIVNSIRINVTGNYDYDDTTGAVDVRNLSYSTFDNNNFTGGPRGMNMANLQSVNITNNNVSKHTQQGIYILGGSNLLINNNEVKRSSFGLFFSEVNYSITDSNNFTSNNGASGTGISILSSPYNNFTNNNLSENDDYGLWIRESNYTIIENNTINAGVVSNNKGIFLNSSSYSIIANNIVNSNNYGIWMNTSHFNNITNNTVNSNSLFGLLMIIGDYNIFTNNTFNSNPYGINIRNGNYNQFTNNIIDTNTKDGIDLSYSNHNNFLNNTARTNNVWEVNISGSNNNTFTNLTIGPLISFTAKNISLKNTSYPAADPTAAINISKWINITNNTLNAWIYLNISYTDAEIGALDESLFIIGRYNGSWETTTSAFANPSGVITALNYVYANITSFSIFAPFEFTSGDSTSPVSILDSPANNTFSASALIDFNCSATDETQLSNVTLFSTINGSWSSNRSYDISGVSNQTNLTVNGIADGTYIWNCLVKDTSNNEAFNTTNYTITIDTTPPSEVTLLSPAEAYSSTDTSVNFSFLTLDNLDTNLTCNLALDSVVTDTIGATSGTPASIIKTVAVGSHQWNVTCYDDALNSNISVTNNFTITQAAAAPPTSGGGGGTVGGGSPPTPPEPPAGLPGGTLPPPAQPPAEPPGNAPPFDDVLPPDDPALSNIMGSVIAGLNPIQVDLGSSRLEKGVEVQFGGRGRLKLFFAKSKLRARIEINDENLDLSLPQLPINWYALFFPILLILALITLVYTGVDYIHERFMPKLTELKTIAIKAIELIVKIAGDNPTKKTLDKCMNIFTKFISKQFKIIKPTYDSAFKAMPNDKRKKDFLKIYAEFKAKEGKSITKKELKTITKDMIKLIKKL